ncbi:MAG: right-handed parallel beta-helix repeat-containing protein [Bacteroidales bacterium]|nr:right-handed parallel beta-helix repeat-containing protein [Bacteroidales bacterium]
MNNNGTYGAFWFDNCGSVTLGSNITYSGNEWPLSMDIKTFLDASSTIPSTGNTNNGIRILGGSLDASVTWHNFPGMDYFVVSSPTISASGSLTINDGNTVRFNTANNFNIYGTLNAMGTSGNGILFTQNGTSQWGGLQFKAASSGTLEYCTVEYATYSTGYAVYANDPTSLTIDHCSLQNNKYGFYGTNGSPLLVSGNQIINNSQDGIFLSGNCNPVFGNAYAKWNNIYGNGGYNIRNNTSGDIDAQYVYWGTTDSLTITTTIYDFYDDGSKGIVNFYPWTNAAHNPLVPFDIDLRVFIEGAYNGTDMNTTYDDNGLLPLSQPFNTAPWNYPGTESVASIPNDVVDWVLVELRDTTDASLATADTWLSSQAAFLLKDGSIVGMDGISPLHFPQFIDHSLFAIVWHRNHLGIISANPLVDVEGVFSLDFTPTAGRAFGIDAQKDLGGGVFGLYAGDGNADGIIDETDINNFWKPHAGKIGNYKGDFNMDTHVRNQDKNDYWYPNVGKVGYVPLANSPVNLPPYTPSSPNPGDAATGEPINSTLSWVCSDPENDPLTYDVYFGTSNPPAQVVSGQTGTTWDPGTLQYSSQYFWKIVAHDDQGNFTEGPVWSFITTSPPNLPPDAAFNPIPQDGTINYPVEGDTLFWSCSDPENDPLTYDVYFGETNPPALVSAGQTDSIFVHGILDFDSTYFWKIVAHDDQGNFMEGPVWSFGTVSPPNLPPDTTSNPIPQDGAINYPVEGDTLFWSCNDPENDPLTYDVYFGTSNPPSLTSSGQTDTIFVHGMLDYDSNYFWKIVAHDDHGNFTEGSVWNFFTTSPPNLAPLPPYNPVPQNGAMDYPIDGDTLFWSCSDPENDPLTYDVYFGTSNPPYQVSSGQTDTIFVHGMLDYDSTYFWKIVAHDDHGNFTEGAVWSFTAMQEPWLCGDTIIDNRDGNKYATVQIGNQCWMAKNLAYLPSVSPSSGGSDTAPYYYVYNYQGTDVAAAKATQNYQDFGVLYNFPAAQNACPSADGWHTPNDSEWKILEGNVDSQYPAGDPFWDQYGYRGNDANKNLKSTSGWNNNGNGLDLYGFSALPAGGRSFDTGIFYGLGGGGRFWTFTEASAGQGWYRILFSSTDSVYRAAWHKGLGYSVRCVYGEALANQPPSAPHFGVPEDGSTDQAVTGVVLSWSSLDADNDPLTYDVGFGTTNPPATLVNGQSESTYDPGLLQYNTQYFWRIVAHDDQGNMTNGPVWSFTTIVPPNLPPDTASNPIPVNGAINYPVEGDTLFWSCSDPENDPMTYDVYFGETNPPALVSSGQADTNYLHGMLNYSTAYYWKIVAYDDHSNSTEGVVWSFTTIDQPWICGDPIIDARDGKQYATVQIGTQCWMAENLNIGTRIDASVGQSDNGTIEKYCYNNDEANCAEYGGFYNWDEMMAYNIESGSQGICPLGWHVPTDLEWCTLENEVDAGTISCANTGYRGTDAGGNLKESGTAHWSSPNVGATNSSGFTALGGGFNGPSTYFNNYAFFWTSDENGSYAWQRALRVIDAKIHRDADLKSSGYSVRCIKSGFTPPNQAPETPSLPNPEDGAVNQTIGGTTLSWSCSDPENDPLTYDVYFGETNPPSLVSTGQSATTYDPGTLNNNTTYYWKIAAHDNHSNSTEGVVWSFTTIPEPNCDDGIPCTYDYYDGSTGTCVHIPDDSFCDDGDPNTIDVCNPSLGCTSTPFSCGDTFVDARDGNSYTTVQIGTQCWMAENLNIGTMINSSNSQIDNSIIEKYCYDDNSTNCDTYGGLYQWNEMMNYVTTEGTQGICPDGWYMPTDNEWETLMNFLGGGNVAGGEMKSTRTDPDAHPRWNSPNSGANNNSGFTAYPGGSRKYNATFPNNLGANSLWWSSSQNGSNHSWLRILEYSSAQAFTTYGDKSTGMSIRCLKD